MVLTDNWRGRNKRNKRNKIPNSLLLESLLKNNWNFRQSLIDIGLTPKGGNYNRCHLVRREYEEFGLVTENKVTIDIQQNEFIDMFYLSDNIKDLSDRLNISYKRCYKYMSVYNCKFISKMPELEELLINMDSMKSFVKLGKYYNMSDNGVRKWFKKYDIDPKTLLK